MKKYEAIIEQIKKDFEIYGDQLKIQLLLSDFLEYDGAFSNIIKSKLSNILCKFPLSSEYIHYVEKYYSPIWGKYDFYIFDIDGKYRDCSIEYNWKQTRDEYPTLLPIANIDGDDYIYLTKKGEVIKFLNIGTKEKPSPELLEVSQEEYDAIWDIAYLDYPDNEGYYRMYWILAKSFDEFMNDCVFGDRYVEITEEEDDFYRYVKGIRRELNID